MALITFSDTYYDLLRSGTASAPGVDEHVYANTTSEQTIESITYVPSFSFTTRTSSLGVWSLELPPGAEMDLTLPDGTVWRGTVPASGGPYNMAQLISENGWTIISPVGAVASLISGTVLLPDGSVTVGDHGNLPGGSLHAVATTSTAGFESAADKTKLDGIEALADVTDFGNVSGALAGATASVSLNNQRLTDLSDPVNPQDAATMAFVESLDAGDVQATRAINTGDGLSGGGDLSTDRTLAVDATVVRTSRTLTAGDGLAGGGDLSADRSLAVQAADGSIVSAPAGVSVGTISDAQHGNLSGGALHSTATSSTAGFESAADKTHFDLQFSQGTITYYIDPTGNDLNDGLTPGTALLTPAAGLEKLPLTWRNSTIGGVTFVMAPGTYDWTSLASGFGNSWISPFGFHGIFGRKTGAENLTPFKDEISFVGGFIDVFGAPLAQVGFANATTTTRPYVDVTVGAGDGVVLDDARFFGRTAAFYSAGPTFVERVRITGNDAQVGTTVRVYLTSRSTTFSGGGPVQVIIERPSVIINHRDLFFREFRRTPLLFKGIKFNRLSGVVNLIEDNYIDLNTCEWNMNGGSFLMEPTNNTVSVGFKLSSFNTGTTSIVPGNANAGLWFYNGVLSCTSNVAMRSVLFSNMTFFGQGSSAYMQFERMAAKNSFMNSVNCSTMTVTASSSSGAGINYFNNTYFDVSHSGSLRINGSLAANIAGTNPAFVRTLQNGTAAIGMSAEFDAASSSPVRDGGGNLCPVGYSIQSGSTMVLAASTDVRGVGGVVGPDVKIGADFKTYADLDANTPKGWTEVRTAGPQSGLPTGNFVFRL